MSDALEILGMALDQVAGYDIVGADDITALLGAAPQRGYRQPSYGGRPMASQQAQQLSNLTRQALASRATYLRNQAPNRSNRIILPMTSSGNITASAAVTARPQSQAYRPEKIIVGGTPTDWLIDDIKVGNRSQFSQAGSMPAEAFASNALGNEVLFETVQTAMDFVIQVTFLGASSVGAQFRSVVFGTAVDH